MRQALLVTSLHQESVRDRDVAGKIGSYYLDGDLPRRCGIAREKRNPHAAFPQNIEYLVPTEDSQNAGARRRVNHTGPEQLLADVG
jgi:hypothetical protein